MFRRRRCRRRRASPPKQIFRLNSSWSESYEEQRTRQHVGQVTTEIRGEQIESATVNEAAERVWMRMSSQSGVAANEASVTASASEHIESCADFQSLMPAYVGRELSEARALLLVDHTHECIPCRRALKEARTTRVAAAVAPRRQTRKASRYSLRSGRSALGNCRGARDWSGAGCVAVDRTLHADWLNRRDGAGR